MYVIPALLLVFALWGILDGEPAPSTFFAVVCLLLILIVVDFASLTIRVEADGVHWSFGFGWPSGELRLDQIQTVAITRTNMLEGWGLHYTIWHGWLWNVWGFQAVQITYSGGRRVTLGTDDPQGLRDAIERFRKDAA